MPHVVERPRDSLAGSAHLTTHSSVLRARGAVHLPDLSEECWLRVLYKMMLKTHTVRF